MSRRVPGRVLLPIAALAGLALAGPLAAAPRKAVPPGAATPASALAVTPTPAGGMLIGRATAPVRLVEFASYTCPHCALFEVQGMPTVATDYLRPGRASMEIRPLLRDPVDVAAALLARCGGPARFLANHDYLMRSQGQWLPRAYQVWQQRGNAWEKLPAARQPAVIAADTGLLQQMQGRGLSPAQLRACLLDPRQQAAIAKSSDNAKGPLNIQGTPSFMLNGIVVQGVFDWASLAPILAAAR